MKKYISATHKISLKEIDHRGLTNEEKNEASTVLKKRELEKHI